LNFCRAGFYSKLKKSSGLHFKTLDKKDADRKQNTTNTFFCFFYILIEMAFEFLSSWFLFKVEEE